MEKLSNMPHNRLRKAACIKQCMLNLEGLQRRYKPIFDEDEAINKMLEQMKSEYERVMETLRQEPDVDALMRMALE